jgi:hypothetical protein
VVDIWIYPSSFASMSKRNNCGIQDKFGVPAQEQAQLKATVDGRRADIVVVGFEVAVSTLDSTVAKARSSRSALAGEFATCWLKRRRY